MHPEPAAVTACRYNVILDISTGEHAGDIGLVPSWVSKVTGFVHVELTHEQSVSRSMPDGDKDTIGGDL